MTLLDKIWALRSKFLGNRGDAQDVAEIDGWYEEAKRLFLIKSLLDNDGAKYVLEIFQGEVEKINMALLKTYSKDMSDSERDRLLDKRDLAQRYLDLFSGIDNDLEKLEETVDKEG